MKFEFATATRIVFGAGRAREAVPAAASLGHRALIVAGSNPSRLDYFIKELKAQKVPFLSAEPWFCRYEPVQPGTR